MSTVKVVANAKATKANGGTPVYVVPSTSKKAYRVQVQSSVNAEVVPGLVVTQNRVGFIRFTSEDAAKEFVANAAKNGHVLTGKVIYVDTIAPISNEAPQYGLRYPYPVRHNGAEVSYADRELVQVQAAAAGVTLMHMDTDGVMHPIYRNKVYTELTDAKDIILSVHNQEQIEAFTATVLSGTGNTNAEAKAARIAELKAIPKAKRTPAEVAELADLMD